MLRTRRSFAAPIALLSPLMLAACPLMSKATDVTASSGPATITVVQGNGQSAQAGRALGFPVVLRVVDENGRGLPKQTSTLVVTAGGGSVTPATVVSDSTGEMKLTWTLGVAQPAQTLVASVGALSVNVNATALFPTQVIVAQGQQQSGKVATVLKNDIVVRVVGASNQPMVNVPVTFVITEGGGGISPQSGVTNAQGELATKWTLGANAGSNTLVAAAGDLPTAVVKAVATP